MTTTSRAAIQAAVFSILLLGAAGRAAAQATDTVAATPNDGAVAATPNDGTAAAAGGAATAVGSEPAAKEPEQKSEQTPENPPSDGFRMGAFTFKPGGRVKLDVIRDFKPIGSEDSFDTRTIPVDGSEGTNSNVHAKETRLNLDIRGTTQDRELRMFIETDFYGSSGTLRLRHAYGQYGGLTAGQTWTTFMDDDNLPRTIDFESPTAFAQVRQAQVRWTQKVAGFITWSAALEDNKSAITIPTSIPGKAEYPMPDLVTKFRFDVPHGHVTTSAFLGQARFRPTAGDADTVQLWGTMASVKFTPFGNDSVYGVFTVGDGIGRYRGGTTAIPDETGKLHAIGGTAFMGGYEHFWRERWSTNATYSVGTTHDEAFFTNAINKELTYGAVNLLYWFLGDRAWTGVEYLYGHREVFADSGDGGSAHRVQYAVRFNLP